MNPENAFQLSSQYLLSLTYQGFNKLWQEDMIMMTNVLTPQTPSTTKPFLSHTSRSRTKLPFLSHCTDPFHESVCESAEENLLHLDELKSPPSSLFNLLHILLNSKTHQDFYSHSTPGKHSV